MPCWTVTESAVDLDGANPTLLQRTLESLGYSNLKAHDRGFSMDRFSDRSSVILQDGRVTIASAQDGANLAALASEVKRQYSANVVAVAAKQFGFSIRQTGERRYSLQKGY